MPYDDTGDPMLLDHLTHRARRRLAAAGLATALVLGAGCSVGSTGSDVAKAVENTLELRGWDVEEVSCPEGLDAEDDSTTCQVTVGGKDYPLEVTSQGSGGSRGNDIDFDAGDVPKR
ncbi:DUF4333 domain-containing protein [Nocardioides aurantiacus]|uniref:DUF4333 domain-containing protein n=1 Tax=Nocardioides aurantiacus TaxID=86796 RepID=UPI000F483B6A|nr:DUF4333 domain-containing protein [Nocardioides aurantiacus]